MCGDYLLFWFFRDHVARDIDYLLGHKKIMRWRKLFGAKSVRWLTPFLGALVLASPLPDEIGLAMLGFAKLKTRTFLVLSYVFNVIGILLVGYVARMVAGI
jgi:hypothetical protein